MAIEIVDFPMNSMVDLSTSLCWIVSLPEGNSPFFKPHSWNLAIWRFPESNPHPAAPLWVTRFPLPRPRHNNLEWATWPHAWGEFWESGCFACHVESVVHFRRRKCLGKLLVLPLQTCDRCVKLCIKTCRHSLSTHVRTMACFPLQTCCRKWSTNWWSSQALIQVASRVLNSCLICPCHWSKLFRRISLFSINISHIYIYTHVHIFMHFHGNGKSTSCGWSASSNSGLATAAVNCHKDP